MQKWQCSVPKAEGHCAELTVEKLAYLGGNYSMTVPVRTHMLMLSCTLKKSQNTDHSRSNASLLSPRSFLHQPGLKLDVTLQIEVRYK